MKRKTGGFVKGRRDSREKRERISLRKESRRYTSVESNEREEKREKKERTTISGSRRPSIKTGYSQELRGVPVEKAYGDQGYRKGMKKRPRRKLTLGNMVMMKNLKRVEGIESKDTGEVGGQRVRQRIRVFWDRRNRERRKSQINYRKKGKRKGRSGKEEKVERKHLRKGRERYVVVRECEVYRNGYEVRSRYQRHERGKKRKEWWLEEKYPAEGKGKKKIGRVERRRKKQKKEEGKKLEKRYVKKREEGKKRFERKYKERKEVCEKEKGRKEREHVKILLGRSERTRRKPRKVKNREKVERREKEEEKDESREVLIAAPTTQYYAKRKNRVRRKELEGTGEKEREKKKWRKVEEKERTVRKPRWSELDTWMNRRMQKVEDENRKRLMEGGERKRKEAKYIEFGKKAVYFYGAERSERWKKRKEKDIEKKEKRGKKNGKRKQIG